MIRFRYLGSKAEMLKAKINTKKKVKSTDMEATSSSDYDEFRGEISRTKMMFNTTMSRIMERDFLTESLKSEILDKTPVSYTEYKCFVDILTAIQNYLKKEKRRISRDTYEISKLLRTIIVMDNFKVYLFTSDIMLNDVIKKEVSKNDIISFVDTKHYTYEDYINASKDERVQQWIM